LAHAHVRVKKLVMIEECGPTNNTFFISCSQRSLKVKKKDRGYEVFKIISNLFIKPPSHRAAAVYIDAARPSFLEQVDTATRLPPQLPPPQKN